MKVKAVVREVRRVVIQHYMIVDEQEATLIRTIDEKDAEVLHDRDPNDADVREYTRVSGFKLNSLR
jgi:hypothetical protein